RSRRSRASRPCSGARGWRRGAR
ncbi:unnamed protein product, partial [Plutella xylostella]